VFTFAVETPERIGAWFALLHFKSGRVHFVICFVAPCKFIMMDSLMWAVALYTFFPLNSAYPCRVAPFLAILALENA